LLKKGKSEEALSHLSAAVRLAPFDTTMHYNFGKVLLDFDRPQEAAACFITTLDNNPDFPAAHNGLGKAYWKQGKLDQATNQLSRAVTLEPDNPHFIMISGPFCSQTQTWTKPSPNFPKPCG